MVVKLKESFEKTRQVKKTTTNLKNTRYHEKSYQRKRNLIILSIFSNFIIDTELKFSACTKLLMGYPMIYHTLP